MGLINYFGLYSRADIQQQVRNQVANMSSVSFFEALNNEQLSVNADHFNYINDGYATVSAVYECVDLIMKKIIASPALIYEVKSVQKLKMYDNLAKSNSLFDNVKAARMKADAISEVDIPGIRDLIETPNDKQTWDEFVGLITVLYLVTGNSFVYGNASEANIKNRKWSEIHALPYSPNDVTIKGGSLFEKVTEYVVSATGNVGQIPFDANQIEHLKTVNPLWKGTGSTNFGMSPLRAYVRKLLRERVGDDQANKILNNGGNFGILSPKNKEDQFGKEQKQALREQMTDAKASREELARIFPVSVPLDWLPIGLPAADLQLLELSKAGREDIYRAFHVPLTYASTDQASYNNANAHGKQFIYNAVAPICEVISRALTSFICGAYATKDKRYIIRLDYMSLPELSQDMKEVAEWLAKCDDLTFNEKREAKGFGRIEDPGMDTILVNRGKVKLQDVIDGSVNDTTQSVRITE